MRDKTQKERERNKNRETDRWERFKVRKRDETEQEKRGHRAVKETKNYLLTRTQKREVYFSLPFLSFTVN